MAVGKIKGGKVKSIDRLRKDNARGGAGSAEYMLTVPADSELTVRFLTEPDGWAEYMEHYVEDHEPRFFPCNDGDCDGCDAGDKPSKKWAALVVDVEKDQVRVLKMGITIEKKVFRRYDKNQTLMDREYTIMRSGSGKNDTEYDLETGSREKFPYAKYRRNMPDLDDFLLAQITGAQVEEDQDDDDDDAPWEDDKPARRGVAKKSSKKAPTRRRLNDDDEDDDDEDERPARRGVKKPAGLKKPLRRNR